MRKIKSREEMLASLHLTQTEIGRLFGLSYQKAKKVFTLAIKKDKDELKERLIYEDRARMSSVLWALGITPKEFEHIIANELKKAVPPWKSSTASSDIEKYPSTS